jgi:hypothetical protein
VFSLVDRILSGELFSLRARVVSVNKSSGSRERFIEPSGCRQRSYLVPRERVTGVNWLHDNCQAFFGQKYARFDGFNVIAETLFQYHWLPCQQHRADSFRRRKDHACYPMPG